MIKLKYVWLYLVFIFTIVILVSVNAWLIQNAINHNLAFNRIIGDAARQRMLSQKLVNGAIQLENGETLYTDFRKELDKWNKRHLSLQKEKLISQLPDAHRQTIMGMFDILNPVQANLNNQLKLVATTIHDAGAFDNITEYESIYLPAMDKIVSAMQEVSDDQIQETQKNQKTLVIVSGLILILEILFFVIPYHRKLVMAYRQLKKQKNEIEEKNEEIDSQNAALEQQNTELEKLHDRQDLTLAGINAGVWDWNVETGKEEWSPKYYELLGYTPGEIDATSANFLENLLHPEDRGRFGEEFEAHLKNDIPYKQNIRLRHKDSTYKWFEASGQAKRDVNGRPLQMAGSIINIDDKVKYREQLELLNHTKDKLFSIVAHDLRNPIISLKSLIELKQEGLINAEEFSEYMDKVKENVTFLSQTMDNLLQWSQSQMHGFKRIPVKVDVSEAINTVIKLHENAVSQKNIHIGYKNSGPSYVLADKDHVFLVIRNIVSNAVKFTPDNGSIEINSYSNGRYECIAVSDTGQGMSQNDINLILDKESLFSKPGTNGEKGTGLGLNLCREVLQENEGKLDISSEPGKGSTFIACLPRYTEQ